jgi:hypothetical protein
VMELVGEPRSRTPRFVVVVQRADNGVVVGVLGPWIHGTAQQVLDSVRARQEVNMQDEDGRRWSETVDVVAELHRVIPLRELRNRVAA